MSDVARVPVAATHVGGVSEIVNPRNGYLLGPHPTAAQLADTLLRHARLPAEQRASLRYDARAQWERTCHAEANYRAFVSALQAIC